MTRIPAWKLAALNGALWLAIGLLNREFMGFTQLVPGINFVYLPAGLRLLLVLLLGGAGALGILIANPVLFLLVIGPGTPLEIATNSLAVAFVPYFAVRLCAAGLRIEPSLGGLRPWHLPIMSLAVSVASPLLINHNFLLFGRHPAADFVHNTTSMMVGDFLGCLLVIATARLAIWAYRRASA